MASPFKIYLLLIVALCGTVSAKAQECRRTTFVPYDSNQHSPIIDTDFRVTIQQIDAQQLLRKLAQDRRAHPQWKCQLLVFSSTSCGGTIGSTIQINKLRADYGDSLGIYWVVGDVRQRCQNYHSSALQLAAGINFYAVADQYADKEDAREGNDRLSKEAFPVTANDIIFTPKWLLIDCSTGQLKPDGTGRGKYDTWVTQVQAFMNQ